MRKNIAALLSAVALAVAPIGAQQYNLDESFPVQMEDAEPIPYGILQGQAYLRPSYYSDGTTEYRVAAGLQIGFAPRWQAALSIPAVWGTVLQTTGGDLLASALCMIAPEKNGRPAFALEGFVSMPMALAVQNADLRLKLIATKTLNRAEMLRAHANISYGYLTEPGPNERRSYYAGSLGLSRVISPGLTLVADYAHEDSRIIGRTADMIEAGLRVGLSPAVTASFSAAAGIGVQSLDYRASAGLQIWLCDLVCPPGGRR